MSADFARLDLAFEVFRAELKVETANLRAEIQTMRADLSKQIADQQRWTLAYVFAMLGCVMAYQRYLA